MSRSITSISKLIKICLFQKLSMSSARMKANQMEWRATRYERSMCAPAVEKMTTVVSAIVLRFTKGNLQVTLSGS